MSRYRLRIEYTLLWRSDWHVGSGFGSAAVDRLVRRRVRGGTSAPYVPGSQIKGVLRQHCEQLVATLGGDVVDLHGADVDGNADLVDTFVPAANSRLIIDRLFGSRYQGECLYCSNAEPSENRSKALPVMMRNSIDRATGTAAAHKLFSTEVVPAGWYELKGEIEGRHTESHLTASESASTFPYEYSILVAALRLLDALGGDRSVGRGEVELRLEQIRWRSPTATAWATIDCAESLAPLGEDAQLAAAISFLRGETE